MINLNILRSISDNSFILFPDTNFQNNNGDDLSQFLESKIQEEISATEWEFQGSDTKSTFDENLKTQPDDWYYRTNKIKYTLNSEGYRTREFCDIDWENSIVMFGCSFIFGTGVDDTHTIPYFLEKNLGIPVVNMGIGGSSIQLDYHNSIMMEKKYPSPKAIIYVWTSLTRDLVYTKDDGVLRRGKWNNELVKTNPTNIVAHNLINIMSIRNLWKNKTIVLEYSFFNQTKRIIKKTIDKDVIVYNFPEKEFDLARDLHHYGKKSNYIIANSVKKNLKKIL